MLIRYIISQSLSVCILDLSIFHDTLIFKIEEGQEIKLRRLN